MWALSPGLVRQTHGNEEDTCTGANQDHLRWVQPAANGRKKWRIQSEECEEEQRLNNKWKRYNHRHYHCSSCTVYTNSFCLQSGGFMRKINRASRIRRVKLQDEEVKMRKPLVLIRTCACVPLIPVGLSDEPGRKRSHKVAWKPAGFLFCFSFINLWILGRASLFRNLA